MEDVGPTLFKCYSNVLCLLGSYLIQTRVVVSTAAFHARVRGSVPGLGGLKETKMFFPHPRVKLSIVGSLRPPGLDFRILCLEDSVISFISPSSGGSPGPV